MVKEGWVLKVGGAGNVWCEDAQDAIVVGTESLILENLKLVKSIMKLVKSIISSKKCPQIVAGKVKKGTDKKHHWFKKYPQEIQKVQYQVYTVLIQKVPIGHRFMG